jgi:hypothetical protein
LLILHRWAKNPSLDFLQTGPTLILRFRPGTVEPAGNQQNINPGSSLGTNESIRMMAKTLDAAFSAVMEEKQGFRFGKPQRLDEKSLAVVLPIVRASSLGRSYVTFPECQDQVLVFDTGKIDVMEADNKTDQNVFVRSGTLFKGATQERALQRSAFLFPKEKAKLSVRCVHATRGINPNSIVTYGGVTPLAFDQKVYDEGYTPADQSTYWSSVNETTKMFCGLTGKAPKIGKGQSSSMPESMRAVLRSQSPGAWYGVSSHHQYPMAYASNSNSPEETLTGSAGELIGAKMDMASFPAPGQDDLASHLDDFATSFDSLLSKLELQENQVGLGLITHTGVQTIEFFDHTYSWQALHESAIKRIGSHVISKADPSVFEYKPEAAKAQIKKILDLDWDTKKIWGHQSSNGDPDVKLTGLSAEGFVGEAMEVNKNLIHLVILKRAA